MPSFDIIRETNRITYSFVYVGAEQKEQLTSNEAF